MDILKFREWMTFDPESPMDPEDIQPTLADLRYQYPNSDGSRKSCGNCIFWKSALSQCALHSSRVLAPQMAVCGMHVFGLPNPVGQTYGAELDPEMTKLRMTRGGACCANCVHYSQSGGDIGVCQASRDDGAHPVVQSLAKCDHWDERDDG